MSIVTDVSRSAGVFLGLDKDVIQEYYNCGLISVPAKDKKPNISDWKNYQSQFKIKTSAFYNQIKDADGFGFFTGDCSGGLMALDFDNKDSLNQQRFVSYVKILKEEAPGLYEKLVVSTTPSGGNHIYTRVKKADKNEKLAMIMYNGEKVTLIETRGEGGFIRTAPTKGYNLTQGSFLNISVIDDDEYKTLISIAKKFDQIKAHPINKKLDAPSYSSSNTDGLHSLELWENYISIDDITNLLVRNGWQIERRLSNKIHLTRPGKSSGTSGTLFISTKIFYVLSSNANVTKDKMTAQDIFIEYEFGGDRKSFYKKLFSDFKPQWNFTDTGISYHVKNTVKAEEEEANIYDLGLNEFQLYDKIKTKDFGQSELCQAYFKQGRRYDMKRQCWFIYSGGVWRQDDSHSFVSEVYSFLSSLLDDYLLMLQTKMDSIPNNNKAEQDKIKSMISVVRKRYEYLQNYNNVVQSMKAYESDSSIEPTIWNKNKLMLNFRNGVYNLENHEFIEHEYKQYSTFQLNYDFESENSNMFNWYSFLNDTFLGNEELIPFIQKLCGVWLTGMDFQKLVFAYGTGANGKSVFFNAVKLILNGYQDGEISETGYCSNFDVMTFSQQNRGRGDVKYGMSKLQGVRLAIASELPKNLRLNEATIKDVTGGESIEARNPYQLPFTFKPHFKLCIFGNSKPTIKDTSYGFWRRFLLIPFTNVVPEAKRKELPEMMNNFWSENSAIMNWMIEGYKKYKSEGLNPPEIVVAQTETFRIEEDVLEAVITNNYVRDTNGFELLSDVHKVYCEETGEKISSKSLAQDLRNKNYRVEHSGAVKNKVVVHGIKCNEKL